MRCTLVLVTLVIGSVRPSVGSDYVIPPYEINVGIKVWSQTMIYMPEDGRRCEASGSLIGPTLKVDLPDEFWLSGMFLLGKLDYEKPNDLAEWDSREAEFVFGRTFGFVKVGVGFRYSLFEFIQTVPGGIRQDIKIYGPLVYTGFGFPLGDISEQDNPIDQPIGCYCGASWMFEDLSNKVGDGEHWNVEAGFYIPRDKVNITLGYRYKSHFGKVGGLHFQGVAFSLSYRF